MVSSFRRSKDPFETGSLTRRDFIAAASAFATAALLPFRVRGAERPPASPRWPIGCHTRPFHRWNLSPDAFFDAVKAAGYASAEMLGEEWMGGWAQSNAATPEYLASIKEKLEVRGLRTTMDVFDVGAGLPPEAAYAAVRKQIDCAHALGQRFLISFGAYKADEWARTCKFLAYGAAYGQDRAVKIVLKQHDTLNRTAVELLGWLLQVNHPNFGLFYDAGNVVHYTGADPVAQLDIVASRVNGVVAKDCAGPHGEVMIQFGTGKVDFAGMFRKLNSVGFNGPVMVEGAAVGSSLEETIANVRANREYLERIFARI